MGQCVCRHFNLQITDGVGGGAWEAWAHSKYILSPYTTPGLFIPSGPPQSSCWQVSAYSVSTLTLMEKLQSVPVSSFFSLRRISCLYSICDNDLSRWTAQCMESRHYPRSWEGPKVTHAARLQTRRWTVNHRRQGLWFQVLRDDHQAGDEWDIKRHDNVLVFTRGLKNLPQCTYVVLCVSNLWQSIWN